jgi:hypothetical protein
MSVGYAVPEMLELGRVVANGHRGDFWEVAGGELLVS